MPTGGWRWLGLWVAVVAAAGGCEDRETRATDPEQAKVTTALSRDVDILVVVDNSASLVEEQPALAAGFAVLADRLLEADIGSVHVAVISSDVGVGAASAEDIFGCSDVGDDGLFLTEPQGACTPPSGNFLIDDDLSCTGDGCSRNYAGTFAESLICVAPAADGCGFEQPLESMRRALDGRHSFNDGFLRDDAMLAIVFLTDEDDCSVFDTDMFDASQTSVSDPLGPLASFRCFEFGVACDPDDPRTPGPRRDCAPREDSEFMTPVSEFVDFLIDLKGGDATQILVAGVAGQTTPVTVGIDDQSHPTLEPSCQSVSGDAKPAVRLAAFAAAFASNGSLSSICDFTEDGADGFEGFANSLADRVGTAVDVGCLPEALAAKADAEDATVSCIVNEFVGGSARRLPECGEGDTGSCYVIEPSALCPGGVDGRVLRIERTDTAATGTVTADCELEILQVRESYYECSTGGRSGAGSLASVLALMLLAWRALRRRRGDDVARRS